MGWNRFVTQYLRRFRQTCACAYRCDPRLPADSRDTAQLCCQTGEVIRMIKKVFLIVCL